MDLRPCKPPMGFEPTIPRLEVWCLVHWATGAHKNAGRFLIYNDCFDLLYSAIKGKPL